MDLHVAMVRELLAKYRNVRVSIERIGPVEARIYMEANTRNRKMNALHARRLQDAMEAGDWWMNGESLIFGFDGALLNGQHRLFAIIASGVTVDVMVVRGIDECAFRTLDGGRIRTTGEVLAMDGEKQANNVAAAVQALVSFVDSQGTHWSGGARFRKATPLLTTRVLEAHPLIRESVVAMQRNMLYRTGQAALLHYLFRLVSPKMAEEFAAVMAEGHSDIGRPFVIFRESLVRTPMRPDLRHPVAARAIKAFNAEQSGQRPKMLRFAVGEEFPTISGLDFWKLADSIP